MFQAEFRRQDLIRAGIEDLFPHLYRFCLVLTGEQNLADDLAQMACLRALEKARQFRAGTHFKGWVYSIAKNLWLDELRKQALRHRIGFCNIDDIELIDYSNDPESRLINRELLNSLFLLPETQRITLLLVYGEGYSYKEAAQILGIPIGTVMSRLATARRKLVETNSVQTRNS